ncbi:hypothetical protein EW026_g6232 [Hermanssonia centrifuga]|uniref:Uncharacterized protein n=1 Tax=Hermanssonia centrifuga TaxID=98765 RepID=A0A4S4KBM1_9APHY|nr:hypothetical protein EW026_g6232 [Hermanssonia centrifuga]
MTLKPERTTVARAKWFNNLVERYLPDAQASDTCANPNDNVQRRAMDLAFLCGLEDQEAHALASNLEQEQDA